MKNTQNRDLWWSTLCENYGPLEHTSNRHTKHIPHSYYRHLSIYFPCVTDIEVTKYFEVTVFSRNCTLLAVVMSALVALTANGNGTHM